MTAQSPPPQTESGDAATELARTKRDLDELRLLYETSQRISTAASIDGIVGAYLEQVAVRGRYTCTVVLYELADNGERLAIKVSGFWSAQSGLSIGIIRLPYQRDDLDPLLDAGQILTFADVYTDPRVPASLQAMQRRDGRPALAMIPLMVGVLRIGLVVLSYHSVHAWRAADLQPYQTTALLLANAIDNQRRQVQLAERQRQVAVLDERRRLARELHDSVTQSLFGMNLLAQALPELWEIDREEAQEALGQIRDLTRSALAEMRALLFELRPAAMGVQSLDFALRDLAGSFERRTGLSVRVGVERAASLPEPVEQALFRIAQEALTNAARHAHASHVQLSLCGGTSTQLTIRDDGRGFDPEEVGQGRFGLTSIRERADSIGATLQLHTSIGNGTEIIVDWPAPHVIAENEQQ